MKIAIMQPYLFPYIGYFQLIHAVDKFLLLDDVAYINKGWINRNRILVNGRDQFFVLPVKGASQNRRINSLSLLQENKWRNNLETTITMAYKKSIGYSRFFPIVREVLAFESNDLSGFLANSNQVVCELMQIKTPIVCSTRVFNNADLKGAERIIDLCRKEHAETYLNPPGGKELYNKSVFEQEGITLQFLQPVLAHYPQTGAAGFIPGLSIIDLLMNNELAFVQEELNHFTLA
jgi:hypothetical protein